jgi:hypothetical protein
MRCYYDGGDVEFGNWKYAYLVGAESLPSADDIPCIND